MDNDARKFLLYSYVLHFFHRIVASVTMEITLRESELFGQSYTKINIEYHGNSAF